MHGTCTHMEIVSDDDHQTSARSVCVVRLVSMVDSRTERLHLLHCKNKVVILAKYLVTTVA